MRLKKILLLADSDSPHTLKWAKSLSKNYEVAIFSLHTCNFNLYIDTPEIKLYSLGITRKLQMKSEMNISKLFYLISVWKIKKVIKEFEPDIVHAHYASSYGLLGSLSGYHPLIISLWGGDIFSFPRKSNIHKRIFEFTLSKADRILSTSFVMKQEGKKYTNKNIVVTPFGIDVDKFSPTRMKTLYNPEDIVIGTIKTLEKRYGIEYLIRAFSIVKNNFPNQSLKLMIVGGGSLLNSLKKLVKELHLENDTTFTGYINPNKVQEYHNMLDIYVAASLEESFGVAVLEANACGKPVVVSNVGGLPEVVEHGKTGFVVDPENPEAIADSLSKLISEPDLRNNMGKRGRDLVLNKFNWEDSINKMKTVYKSIIT